MVYKSGPWTLPGLLNFQILKKLIADHIFQLQKQTNKPPSLRLSIVVWLQYIALKLLEQFGKVTAKKSSRFTLSPRHFTKILKF